MSSITFTGVTITKGSFTNDGGSVSRLIHAKANPTKAVRAAMKWEELPDCAESAKLAGELHASTLVLSPNSDALLKHEIESECTLISDFELKRVQDKGGESRKLELNFNIRISERAALAKIEAYCEKVGEGPASLKIGYTEQSELELEGSEVVGKAKPGA